MCHHLHTLLCTLYAVCSVSITFWGPIAFFLLLTNPFSQPLILSLLLSSLTHTHSHISSHSACCMFRSMCLNDSLNGCWPFSCNPTKKRRGAPGFISVHVCKLICSGFTHNTHARTHSLSLTPSYTDLCVPVELGKVT